jgi:hypothetical protein
MNNETTNEKGPEVACKYYNNLSKEGHVAENIKTVNVVHKKIS